MSIDAFYMGYFKFFVIWKEDIQQKSNQAFL